ncbi:MAG: sodium-dependent transporter, partial [Lachnospiraceae bacterium]|nr:sodium-dependent transporter [Lachnospiraceae bacterium]
ALGQMFYSLSLAMGLLYTYGSYISKDVDIEKSTTQVEIFDTAIAMLAGLMIIPAVFAFSGGNPETLQAGPSLMFITLPKVFASMGMGTLAGVLFFLLVLFAALTSAISLMETSVSTITDELHWDRRKASFLMAAVMLVVGSGSALGFGVLDFVSILGMSILDFFDFLTNSIMMPLAALSTCLLIIQVVGFGAIEKEVECSSAFRRKKVYVFFMKYLAPVCIGIILVSSIANVMGWISL